VPTPEIHPCAGEHWAFAVARRLRPLTPVTVAPSASQSNKWPIEARDQGDLGHRTVKPALAAWRAGSGTWAEQVTVQWARSGSPATRKMAREKRCSRSPPVLSVTWLRRNMEALGSQRPGRSEKAGLQSVIGRASPQWQQGRTRGDQAPLNNKDGFILWARSAAGRGADPL